MSDNIRRLLSQVDTDQHPIVRVKPVSKFLLSDVSRVITSYSAAMYITTKETIYPARIYSLAPSDRPGFVLVYCNVVTLGDCTIEVGAGYPFDFRLAVY